MSWSGSVSCIWSLSDSCVVSCIGIFSSRFICSRSWSLSLIVIVSWSFISSFLLEFELKWYVEFVLD